MSWHFSQALAAAYSAENSLDGGLYARLKQSPIPSAFLYKDRMTAFSHLSRFGMTFVALMEDLGEDLLTWFREAFLAKTSVVLEKVKESAVRGAVCGQKCEGSLIKYDLVSHSWKIRHSSEVGDWTKSCPILPKWGSMQNGVVWEVEKSGLLTKENESGFSHPTPTTSDWKGASSGRTYKDFPQWLHVRSSHGKKSSYVNPQCSEQVMGLPTKWTDLKPLEMLKFQQWRQQHGISYSTERSKKED